MFSFKSCGLQDYCRELITLHLHILLQRSRLLFRRLGDDLLADQSGLLRQHVGVDQDHELAHLD